MVSSYSDLIGAEPGLGHRLHLDPGQCGLCRCGPGHRPALTGDRGVGLLPGAQPQGLQDGGAGL